MLRYENGICYIYICVYFFFICWPVNNSVISWLCDGSLSADSDYSSINYCSADSTRTRLFLHLALFSVKNYRRGRISSLATAFRNCKQRSKALEHVCRIWAGEKRWPASSTQSHNLSGELGNRFRIGIGVRKTNRNPKPNRNRNRNPNPGQPVISALSSQHLGALPLSFLLFGGSRSSLVFGCSGFRTLRFFGFFSSPVLRLSGSLGSSDSDQT